MNGTATLKHWLTGYLYAWDHFWFTPRSPHTLGILRIITGAFLLYSHLVLATDLESFIGARAWINNDTARALHDGSFGIPDMARSYLWAINQPLLIWLHHGLTILISASFMVGFLTRITAPAAWFLQIMYLHRLTGALFGFDQIVTYSTMYLMIAPCGSCFSVDAKLRRRFADRCATNRKLAWLLPAPIPTVSANIATRLLQLHLCVIYLFGGLAKARGQSWWDGTAMWFSVANYEYQSVDMTWISRFPRFFTALSHIAMFWEIFYCALIWPRRTRPITLAIGVAVHGGIALFLGMMTFGMMMIAANMIFIPPSTIKRWLRIESDDPGTTPESRRADSVATSGPAAASYPAASPPAGPSPAGSGADAAIETPAQRTEREAALDQRERQIREATLRLKERRSKLSEREEKYRERVKTLKEREGKIKDLVARRRAQDDNESP